MQHYKEQCTRKSTGEPDSFTMIMFPVPRRTNKEDFEGCLHLLEQDPSSSMLYSLTVSREDVVGWEEALRAVAGYG